MTYKLPFYKKINGPAVLTTSAVALALVLALAPAFMLVLYSFNSAQVGNVWSGFGLYWWVNAWADVNMMRGLLNSGIVSILTAVVSVVLGSLMAFELVSKANVSKFKVVLLLLPIIMPDTILAFSSFVMYSVIGFPKGHLAISLAISVVGSAYVAILIMTGLQGRDVSKLLTAARTLGDTRGKLFTRQYLPLSLPYLWAGFGVTILLAFQDYIYAFMNGSSASNTLSVYVYGLVRMSQNPSINVVYTGLMMTSILIVFISKRYSNANY